MNLAKIFFASFVLSLFLTVSSFSEKNEYVIQQSDVSTKLISGDIDIPESNFPKYLKEAIKNGAQYLQRYNFESGKFVYNNYLNDNHRNKDSYNELRHSGTVYSLWLSYNFNKDPETLKTIKKASSYLQGCCIASVPRQQDMLAVWSDPYTLSSPYFRQAKLGGAGLALVALSGLKSIDSDSVDIETLRKLAKFIQFMLKEDGNYYSKYNFLKGGRLDDWTSLYYPGEAALGLAMLYEVDPDPKWINTSVKILNYLAESRKGKSKVPDDHWALLATNKIFKLSEKNKFDFPKQLFIDHALQICENIIRSKSKLNKKTGVYQIKDIKSDRIAPISTTLEGLLAAYEILPDENQALKVKIMQYAEQGTKFLLRSQIISGEFKGGFPGRVSYLSSQKNYKINHDIRIDYVQHAISAMIQYYNLKYKS